MAVDGVVNMDLNGGSYSNILFQKAVVFEIGGLNATSERNDFTICNTGGFSSGIVFKNAAGTDFMFIGNICDDGNSLQYHHDGVVNIAMDGAGTQRIFQSMFSTASESQYSARQRGTVSAKSGRLFMDNSRIAADYRLAALSLEGGRFTTIRRRRERRISSRLTSKAAGSPTKTSQTTMLLRRRPPTKS